MSVRTMAKVWESSQQAGSDLLMLLAIADFADDDGNAYPSVATLAKKCRMRPRNCQYILRNLEQSGELTIGVNAGPFGANLYRVNLDALGVQSSAGVQSFAGVQHSAPGGAKDCAKGVQRIAPKPSKNHQEPSNMVDGFDSFWRQYPRKVAKSAALKAWRKLKPDDKQLADLMAGLERQKASRDWLKDGGQFIPHPATWLNGRRWEDDDSQAIPAAAGIAATGPKPGDTRQRHGAAEVFDEVAGWVPA